jgi:uridine kinase
MSTPICIGVAGGTGSGKSTIAQNIVAGLPEGTAAVIEHDSYYKSHADLSFEEREFLNYDHPDALENQLLVEHIDALKQREPVEVPVYDFVSHSRLRETRSLQPCPVIIVEGILCFVDEALRNRIDVKIFVDTTADIRVFRRIRRDMQHRGRSFEQIREQYYKTVRPMHLQFVEPSKQWADLIIPEGGSNRVALDLVVGNLLNILSNSP